MPERWRASAVFGTLACSRWPRIYFDLRAVHSTELPVMTNPCPLQAFWPLQEEAPLLQALWPLQALAPAQTTSARAAPATVVTAQAAAVVAQTVPVVVCRRSLLADS